MLDVFPSEYIFLGGDEVNPDCWLQNSEIKGWMNRHNMVEQEGILNVVLVVNKIVFTLQTRSSCITERLLLTRRLHFHIIF